ncbi:MAG: RecQ family ATP-dependent DNA helicase [Chloroflexota bacterium]|nr:RecQ family ATP-dependent DNA helicase [Chloroflexota bacterium]
MSSGLTEQQSHSPLVLEQQLEERFHITAGFHPAQRDIIEHLISGKRVLAIQCTGWGKSLCYQMVSLYYPHLTIVFSPLKALMRDQCQRCNEVYAIPSAIVSSEFTQNENIETLEQAVAGKVKILFIAPERLDNASWQSCVQQMKISMIVIDEAHCISTWGHDFRPNYRRIMRLLTALPKNVPVLALTATANKRVEADILQQIGAEAEVIRGTMQRPNLYLHVEKLHGDYEKLSYLGEILPHVPGTGIIYTATKREAEMVGTFLQQQDIVAEYYHSGREDNERLTIQQGMMADQYKVICSTNALGMGIDKPNIRFIIHYQLPSSPIHYYQEMGRAGRDGKVSYCILLYDGADLAVQEYFIQSARPEGNCYELVLSRLRQSPQGLRESDIMLATGLTHTAIRVIVADLEDQRFIKHNPRTHLYMAISRFGQLDFSAYDAIRFQKEQELKNMQDYALTNGCYMHYLTSYLGDEQTYRCGACGYCHPYHFPTVRPSERIQGTVTRFLEKEFLPCSKNVGQKKARCMRLVGPYPITE